MIRDLVTHPAWTQVTIGACAIGAAGALLFVIYFRLRVGPTWWRLRDGRPNRFGRYMMVRKVNLAALFALVLANRIWPGWTGSRMALALLMVIFALHTFQPLRLLQEAQRGARNESSRDIRPPGGREPEPGERIEVRPGDDVPGHRGRPGTG